MDFTIVCNTLVNHFRQDRCSPVPLWAACQEDPEATLIREETLECMTQVLAEMDQEKRDIFVLRYDKGYFLNDISQLTGISYGMVKVKHSQALESLRRKFA